MFYKVLFKYAFKWALFLFINMFVKSVKAYYLEKCSKACLYTEFLMVNVYSQGYRIMLTT